MQPIHFIRTFGAEKRNGYNDNRLQTLTLFFKVFLQAGYARVLVPVTLGMERLVMLFGWRPELALQQGASSVWALGVQNPLYTALATELYHAHRIVKEEDAPIIDTYVEKVPTNLVYLVNDLEVGESAKLPELPKFTSLMAATLATENLENKE